MASGRRAILPLRVIAVFESVALFSCGAMVTEWVKIKILRKVFGQVLRVAHELSRIHAVTLVEFNATAQRGEPQPKFHHEGTRRPRRKGGSDFSFQDFVTFVVEKFSQERASRSAQRRRARGEKKHCQECAILRICTAKTTRRKRRDRPWPSGSPNGDVGLETIFALFLVPPRLLRLRAFALNSIAWLRLGVARTGDGPLGLRRATAKRKNRKCKYQGLTPTVCDHFCNS